MENNVGNALSPTPTREYVDPDRLNQTSYQLEKLKKEGKRYFDQIKTLNVEIIQISGLFVNVAACQLAIIEELASKPLEERNFTTVPTKLHAKFIQMKTENLESFRALLEEEMRKDMIHFAPDKIESLMQSFTTSLEQKIDDAEHHTKIDQSTDLLKLKEKIESDLQLNLARCTQILNSTDELERERGLCNLLEEKSTLQRKELFIASDAKDIFEASIMGDISYLDQLINSYYRSNTLKAFLDQKNHQGFTPLHLAVVNDHLLIVQRLIKNLADPFLPDQNGNFPIHTAAAMGNIPLAEKLIRYKKENVKARGAHQQTPLHQAAANGKQKWSNFLSKRGLKLMLKQKVIALFFMKDL